MPWKRDDNTGEDYWEDDDGQAAPESRPTTRVNSWEQPDPNEYPGATRDRQGPGGEQEADNRRVREGQARALNERLGLSDAGNLESFLSGRNSWEGYLADQQARITNEPGGRPPEASGPQSGQGGNAINSWLGQGSAQGQPSYAPYLDQQNQLLRQLFDRQVAEQNRIASEQAARDAELKQRRDALFTQLQGRASQSTQIDPNDPIIKGQVDAFRAEQERALRNVRSDAAEGKQSLRPTQDRMATERVSQGVASMQSELMARELTARRAEIADALQSQGGLLGADQQVYLQQQLAQLDNMIQQQQVGVSNRGLDIERELGLGGLNLGFGRLGLDTELGRGRLSLDTELGRGGLSNELMRILNQNQQFYGDLGQRRVESDRSYDLYNRGRTGNPI